MECTLRDGTYVVDFMIDKDTFYTFTKDLIIAGFQNIEVGHGLGLGAFRKYSSGFTDEELWKKLAPLTNKAKLYSFFIPYVGKVDDFRMAREYGLYGLRIGSEPIYIKNYMSVIEEAKKIGYFVAVNLMKSYTVTPEGFADVVEIIKDVADVVYLVDSAGHLLPDEITRYVLATQEKHGMISMGYHGHNNLNLAMANSLQLIDAGVEYIDTTLTGIGRCGGNVSTEGLIAVLAKKYGKDFFPDTYLMETLKIARKFRNYILSKGKCLDVRSEDILFGYAGFHSSYESLLRDYTNRKGLDFYQAILDVSRIERTRLSDDILDNLYQNMTA